MFHVAAKAKSIEAEKQRQEATRAREKAERDAAERERAIKENIAQQEKKMRTEMENQRQYDKKVYGYFM